jgi:hypothetical protein
MPLSSVEGKPSTGRGALYPKQRGPWLRWDDCERSATFYGGTQKRVSQEDK